MADVCIGLSVCLCGCLLIFRSPWRPTHSSICFPINGSVCINVRLHLFLPLSPYTYLSLISLLYPSNFLSLFLPLSIKQLVYLLIPLLVYLSVCPSHRFLHIFIDLSLPLSIKLLVSLSTQPTVCLSIRPVCFFYLSKHKSVFQCHCPSIYPSVCLTFAFT